ncbi:MAG: Dihydrolipoamide acyltransferase component of branched-chain alpha-keto acid dehydrogenase complex [uncultured Sphingomonadaceae bacterium]|uniref:Dihydrolipoamide acetyltransferase component of pyruvate dehydrogenase complex n=1 Tax=uncultured Sphingomonadaceae bacterium TaxID=169976 RepID=A0A6J4T4A1_9SPHN|nr:MAG: Dihydrolipoamide acyltransferase component of branched-chain alpha-keto acid dehydrogenase complex [uncultured Sphingomonadaceae bacterium]
MARFEFRLPDIGEGIAEAEVVAWHVAVGAQIAEDQPLADMMTDKATVEIESPVAGTVVQLAGAVGDQVPIGSVLAVIETAAAGGDAAPATGAEHREQETTEAGRSAANEEEAAPMGDGMTALTPEIEAELPSAETDEAAPLPAPAPLPQPAKAEPASRVLASPAVRQRAKDLGVDLSGVKTASGDRVRHGDLDAFLAYQGSSVRSGGAVAPSRPDEDVRVVGLRRRIAENMAEAKRRIPHFMYAEEVDVTDLEAARHLLNGDRGDRPRLTILPFIAMAVCRALPAFPQINARYDDEGGVVTRSGAVHLGIATQTDAGLSVPVVRNADGRGLWDLSAEIARLAAATRAGKAAREELSGGSITISSLGVMGGVVSTPVINRPEVAIIAVNKVMERPVVVGGQVVVRKMMNLSSSFDHRVVDGWDAASFIQAVRGLLEQPVRMLG